MKTTKPLIGIFSDLHKFQSLILDLADMNWIPWQIFVF